jgi:hypothetical protein
MVVRERQYVLAAAAWYVGPNGEPSGMSAGGWEFLACLCERGAAFAMRRHHYKLRDRLNADGCPRLGTWRFLLRQSSFRSLFVFGHDTPHYVRLGRTRRIVVPSVLMSITCTAAA